MFDATKLLGALLESRAAPSATGRVEHAMRQAAPGGASGGEAGSLGGMLGGLVARAREAMAGGTGAAGAGAPPDLGALLGRVGEMARQAVNDPMQQVKGNNPVAVGGLGALAGGLLGRGGRGAMAGGLLAVLGSLAWQAMQGQAGAAARDPAAALPQTEDALQHEARLILRAVIQAAQSDGTVDGREIGRIVSRLQEKGEDAEARAFVEAEMLKAPDVEALAREVTSPQQAARVYAASLLAIEVDTQAERDHLARLAAALRLPAEAVAEIHRGLGVPA